MGEWHRKKKALHRPRDVRILLSLCRPGSRHELHVHWRSNISPCSWRTDQGTLDAWPAAERKRMIEPYGVGTWCSALQPGCGDVNTSHSRRVNRSKSYRRHPAAAESDAPSTTPDWRGNGSAFSYAANRLPDYEVRYLQLQTETPN